MLLLTLGRQSPSLDDDAIDRLRRQLAGEVKRVCPRRLASERDDIVQAALIRILRLMRGDGDTTISSAYLRRVAVTATIDEIRRQRRRSEDTLADGVDVAHSLPGPEEHAIGQQLQRAIQSSLARLGEARRQAVSLHLRGHSVPEAAHSLGWSRKRVANLTHRGLRDLRRGLVEGGFKVTTTQDSAVTASRRDELLPANRLVAGGSP